MEWENLTRKVKATEGGEGARRQARPVKARLLILRTAVVGVGRVRVSFGIGPAVPSRNLLHKYRRSPKPGKGMKLHRGGSEFGGGLEMSVKERIAINECQSAN